MSQKLQPFPTAENRRLLNVATPAPTGCIISTKHNLGGQTSILAASIDIVRGTWTWVLGVMVMSVAWGALSEAEPGVKDFMKQHFENSEVVTAIGNTVAFLVVARQSAAIVKNVTGVNQFNNLCAAVGSLAIYAKGLGIGARSCAGNRSFPSQFELILRSVPFIAKYKYRTGGRIETRRLPLCQDPQLALKFDELRAPESDTDGIDGVTASVLLLSELVHQVESPRQVDVVYVQEILRMIDALGSADGAMGGSSAYAPPRVLGYMMNVLFFCFFSFLIIGDLVHGSGYNAVWISSVVCLCMMGPYGVAMLYANPFDITRSSGGQTPYISNAAVGTERSVVTIMRGHRACANEITKRGR